MGLYEPFAENYKISEEDQERIYYYHSEEGKEELKAAIETLRKLDDNQLVLYFHRLFAENNGKGLIVKRLGSLEMYGNILFKAYNTVMSERNCKYVDIKCKKCGAVGYMVFTEKTNLKGNQINIIINENFGDRIQCECGASSQWIRNFTEFYK